MQDIIRTRFAPSPTGFLHLGSIRTALFAWLFAKHHNGVFVLRIEDTDVQRSLQEYSNLILDGLTWLGLTWDEGPVYQSDRYQRYNEIIKLLVDSGHAYYCDCSVEQLQQMKEQQIKDGLNPHYDGRCRDKMLSESAHTVVRLKLPKNGVLSFDDIIHGTHSKNYSDMDDWILRRADGHPTYNFAVVVDDHDMNITHVIRGDDHLNNTPKQVSLYQILEWALPKFCHLPMILDEHGARLSKRSGSANAIAYKKEGFIKEGLLNALARLGWSHKDQEIFTISELIQDFNLESLQKSPASFNKEKFLWAAKQHLMMLDDNTLAERAQQEGFFVELDKEELVNILHLFRGRFHSFGDLAKQAKFIFKDPSYDVKLLQEKYPYLTVELIFDLVNFFESVDYDGTLFKKLKEFAVANKLKIAQLTFPLREIITGSTESPDFTETCILMKKDKIVSRLQHFCNSLN